MVTGMQSTTLYSVQPLYGMSEETDDVVGRYKRLLAMARSSLEANQASLAAKDKQIVQLMTALEEERNSHSRYAPRKTTRDDDGNNSNNPRSLRRRIDVEGTIWVLVEYEGVDDNWISFTNESEFDDFILRIPGVPLTKPNKCLTPKESAAIEVETKRSVDKIVEEFRRYKVRSEISRKQRGPDIVNLPGESMSPESSAGADAEVERWKQAYEKLARENEQLRTSTGDALQITQLKQRCEALLQEKEELAEKMKVYSRMTTIATMPNGTSTSTSTSTGFGSGSGSSSSMNTLGTAHHSSTSNASTSSSLTAADHAKSPEQMYLDIRDEYKEFRRRALSLEKQRLAEIDELRAALGAQLAEGQWAGGGAGGGAADSSSEGHQAGRHLGGGAGSASGKGGAPSTTGVSALTENKIVYLRQMVLQYLTCKDPVVRPHIENALVTMLRPSAEERSAIEERIKDETLDPVQDTLSSITSFLGTFSIV